MWRIVLMYNSMQVFVFLSSCNAIKYLAGILLNINQWHYWYNAGVAFPEKWRMASSAGKYTNTSHENLTRYFMQVLHLMLLFFCHSCGSMHCSQKWSPTENAIRISEFLFSQIEEMMALLTLLKRPFLPFFFFFNGIGCLKIGECLGKKETMKRQQHWMEADCKAEINELSPVMIFSIHKNFTSGHPLLLCKMCLTQRRRKLSNLQ